MQDIPEKLYECMECMHALLHIQGIFKALPILFKALSLFKVRHLRIPEGQCVSMRVYKQRHHTPAFWHARSHRNKNEAM